MPRKNQKDKKNPLWNLISTEWNNLGDRKKLFVIYISLFVIAGAINLMTPLVVGKIFNSIQNSITSTAELTGLIKLIFLLLVIEVGFQAFHGFARVLEVRTGFFVNRNYTNRKIQSVLDLPVKWHKDHHSGDTIDKINKGSAAMDSFSSHTTFSVVYAILNIFGTLIILFFVDRTIAIFALVFSSLTLLVIMQADKKLIKYYRELNVFDNKASAAIFDYVSNITTVITLRLKKTVANEVNHKLMVSSATHKKSTILNEFKWGFASIAIALMTVIVLSYKSYKDYTTTGVILIGTLYILYGYLARVGETFYNFAALYGRIVRFDSYINSAAPIDQSYEKVKAEANEKLPLTWRNIQLKNIDFTYDREDKQQHIDNVNISFRRGEKIALIGESGSGKSTILTLMRGLYPVNSGEIYCNGIKLEHGFSQLKNNVTLIPQDPEIFNNTIKYNITMDLPTKKEELSKVVRMAQFEKVVQRLEKGLNTNVMEKGVSLSGGEKQRLALARGLLAAKDSDIVLLDEPTSSVDSANEIKIHEAIFKEFKDKTVISSIHRLHLLKNFDYIYMFDEGKIIAKGSFNDLMKNTKFRIIWKKYQVKGEK